MDRPPSRRRVLSGLSAAASVALAGCAELARSVEGGSGGAPTSGPTPSPPAETPGYKEYHWHGRLFVDVDGELVDFSQPKYYLDNLDDEDAVHFHFHEDAHGADEWSNEKAVVTFAQALDLLPGFAYERGPDGGHAVTVEGTRYVEGRAGTEISISEGTDEIDPRRHYVRHGDAFWVSVETAAGGIEPPADHAGARVGTLLFDVNNRRLQL